MKITNNEIWKPVKGYEGIYEVSNIGNVRSLDRSVIKYNALTKRDNILHIKGQIMKPSINKYGYYYLSLSKDGNRKSHLVHRLVAEAFIDNPNNLPQVNHIDENKLNNNVDNLEFITLEDNVKYSLNQEIYKLDLDGNIIEKYTSINEAGRQNNMKISNKFGFPSSIVRAVEKEYEYKPKRYSVTSLLQADRELMLKRRYNDEIEQDVSEMIWLLFGTSVHYILENIELEDYEKVEYKMEHTLDNGYTLSGILN